MNVTPDDLANACALFGELNTRRLRRRDLIRAIANSLRVSTVASPEEILGESLLCDLIREMGSTVSLTDAGSQVGKSQGRVAPNISERAKRALIRRVYLNSTNGERCCKEFLTQCRVDVKAGTFVYERQLPDSDRIGFWLRVLSRVGLVDVTAEIVHLRHEYLEDVNIFLAEVRGAGPLYGDHSGKLRQLIGDIGEELAIAYEKERLENKGHSWLAPLVERISLVDNYAGYDIRSFTGSGKSPESPIFIEVKGTIDPRLKFLWTYNERQIARETGPNYWIYGYTNVQIAQRTAEGPVRIRDPHKRIQPPGYLIEPRDVLVQKLSRLPSVFGEATVPR